MGINRDQLQGRIAEAKGAVKQLTGKAMGNSSLEKSGSIERHFGRVQSNFGDLREAIRKLPD